MIRTRRAFARLLAGLALLPAVAVLIAGCGSRSRELAPGTYRATLELLGGELPFGLDVAREEEGLVLYLVNGEVTLRRAGGERVTGTIHSHAGDHRVLAGEVRDDELYLSCFDGASADLYEARVDADGHLVGDYWSGKVGQFSFRAERRPDAVLDRNDVAISGEDPAAKLE